MSSGALISADGTIHPYDGISAMCDILEKFIPETNELWEKEWEDAELEYFDEAYDYAMKHGWADVNGEDSTQSVNFDSKLGDEAAYTLINLVLSLEPSRLLVSGRGTTRLKTVSIDDLRGLISA